MSLVFTAVFLFPHNTRLITTDISISMRYASHLGVNLDLALNASPYLMNSKGTGNAKHEIPPSRLAAGPMPKFSNKGRAAIGIAHARIDRRIVFADTALAANGP